MRKAQHFVRILRDTLRDMDEVLIAFFETPDVQERIAEMNRERQQAGLLTDGNQIKPEYSDAYQRLKKLKGLTHEHVDLKLTGQYQRHFFIDVNELQRIIVIRNDDNEQGFAKSLKLEELYTEKIIGLSEQNISELRKLFKDFAIKHIKEKLNVR